MTCTPRNASVFRGVFLRRCPLLFAVLDLLVLLDQAKSTEERILREFKFSDRSFGKQSCTSDWASPARSRFYHLLSPKGGAKSVRQGTSVGIGRRFSLSGHKRLRCTARPLRALEPPSDLIPPPVQCGICGALRATMIYYDSNSSILKSSKPPRAEASARAAPWRRSVAAVDNTPPRQSRHAICFVLGLIVLRLRLGDFASEKMQASLLFSLGLFVSLRPYVQFFAL